MADKIIENNSSTTFIIISVIFLGILGGVVLYLYIKNKNSSKI